jgi:ornithine cyclodeaminase
VRAAPPRHPLHGVGDILQPVASGAIKESDVLGDLYDLAAGATGRQSAGDITFFKNAGGGHLDLMTCEAVFQQLGANLDARSAGRDM